MDTMTIKDRLFKFIEYKELNPNSFEKVTGLSQSFIRKINGSIGSDKLGKIFTTFPELNPNWLINGYGEMILEINTKTLNNTIAPNVFDNEVFECGFPVGESGAITQSSMENTIILPNAPQDIIYIRAHGNSMVSEDSHQSIPDGAYVALRKKQTKVIQWGEVYALATRDGMILKKLMPSEKNGCVRCVSNNKDFPPFDISTQDIIDIAIVVGVIAISWLAR